MLGWHRTGKLLRYAIPPAIDHARELSVFNVPVGQIYTRLRNCRLFRNLMLKILLCASCHDQQAAMWQMLGKHYVASSCSQTKQSLGTQTNGGNYRAHLGFCIGMKPNTISPITIQ